MKYYILIENTNERGLSRQSIVVAFLAIQNTRSAHFIRFKTSRYELVF